MHCRINFVIERMLPLILGKPLHTSQATVAEENCLFCFGFYVKFQSSKLLHFPNRKKNNRRTTERNKKIFEEKLLRPLAHLLNKSSFCRINFFRL